MSDPVLALLRRALADLEAAERLTRRPSTAARCEAIVAEIRDEIEFEERMLARPNLINQITDRVRKAKP